MKSFLPLLLGGLLTSLAAAESEVVTTVRFESIGLETRIQSTIPIWEEVEFSYSAFKNYSDHMVSVHSNDLGRGLAGFIVTLAGPDGKERSWGAEHVDPATYPPSFPDPDIRILSDEIPAGKDLKAQTVDLRSLFGELPAGRYKLRLMTPGDRYRLQGKAGVDLDSGWLPFEIAPMTEKVQRILNQAQEEKQPEGEKPWLLPSQNVFIADAWILKIPGTLENRGDGRFKFTHEGRKLFNGVERLDAALQWREHNDWCSYCASGMVISFAAPGERHPVILNLPGRRGIYRATLRKGSAADAGQVYSSPVQVLRK